MMSAPAGSQEAAPSTGTDPGLAEWVEEIAGQLQAGERVDLDACARLHPEWADQLGRLLPAMEVMADLGRSVAGGEAAATPGVMPASPSVLGDYRIIREVGRGGMGVVYEAEQISLHRRVALKVLPFAAAVDPRQLQRFQLEAQAAACLHHTHIVPVHAVGCDRGVPFYAMQFIRGHSLAELIAELRRLEGVAADARPADGRTQVATLLDSRFAARTEGALEPAMIPGDDHPRSRGENLGAERPGVLPSPSPGPTTRSLGYVRTVAQFGVQVAEALDHAHTRGILHRDIKPGNLLLDTEGQLWVTDFGLARIEGNPCMTTTGDCLGTLRYMSPEQALGRRLPLDGRTDIYSLGVTLYELLTLRPAIDGKDRSEILRRISEEDPAPPRKLNPSTPRDLETVLLKAIAKEPSGRYPTAKELADELRRFLEHRPIISRRPNLLDRAAKWTRRHRFAVWTGSLSLAVLLVLSVLGLAVSNILISREKDQKDVALRQREAALAAVKASERVSRSNLRLARKAVDELYTQLAEELYALPQMQPLQRKFLLQALEFYKEFSAQQGSDPEIRFETARAYRRAGSIQHLLGQGREASEALRRALALLEKLVAEFPAEAKYRTELAFAYSTLGFTLIDSGQTRPGSEAYRRATEHLERLASAEPAAIDARQRLSIAYQRLGRLPGLPSPEAVQALEGAVRLRKELVAAFPAEPQYRAELLTSLGDLSYVLAASGRHADAEKAYRETIAAYETEETARERSPRRVHLIALKRGLAAVLLRAGQAEDAVRVLRQVLTLTHEVLAGAPEEAGLRADLVATYRSLSAALQRLQRHGEAIEALENAVACYDAAAERSGGDQAHPLGKADLLNDLGRLLAEANRPAEGRQALQKASDLCAKVAGQFPDDPAIGRDLQAECYFQWTRALSPLGRQSDAAETARKAIDLYTSLGAQRSDGPAPQEVMYRWRLAVTSHLLGVALGATGHPHEAAEAYRKAVTLHPERALFCNDLAWFLVGSKDPPAHDPAEAVDLARKAITIEPTAAHIWNTLGVAYYRAGQFRAAIAALEKSDELGQGREFGFNAVFLALSRWQLGERDEARRWYDDAVRWMREKKPKDEALRRFQAEAEALIRPEDEE
jgi:serine/threonine-protein kinase